MNSISVVIPAHRAESSIARTLSSILAQDDVELDVVVVVDGVFDRTAEIASGFTGVRVFVNETNQGSQPTRNRGLAEASAPFVTFVDADDYVEGSLHAGMASALEADAADIVLAPWAWERPGVGRRLHDPRADSKECGCQAEFVAWWLRSGGGQSGGFGWRTEALRSIGGWDVEIRRAQDFDVVLRGMMAGLKVTTSRDGLSVYVDHDNGGRITRARIGPTIESQMKTIRAAEVFAEALPNPMPVRVATGMRCYQMASRCFREGSIAEGRMLMRHARRLGFRGQLGSAGHRLISSLLGLEAKQRISAFKAAWLG